MRNKFVENSLNVVMVRALPRRMSRRGRSDYEAAVPRDRPVISNGEGSARRHDRAVFL